MVPLRANAKEDFFDGAIFFSHCVGGGEGGGKWQTDTEWRYPKTAGLLFFLCDGNDELYLPTHRTTKMKNLLKPILFRESRMPQTLALKRKA